jgi:hypothetical protein
MAKEDIFRYWPIVHHGDPGPEIYQAVASLPQEKQAEVARVVSEAIGAIATVKGGAYTRIASIIGSDEG